MRAAPRPVGCTRGSGPDGPPGAFPGVNRCTVGIAAHPVFAEHQAVLGEVARNILLEGLLLGGSQMIFEDLPY